jgi:hypothetical protein
MMQEMEEALKASSASASVLQEEWQVEANPKPLLVLMYISDTVDSGSAVAAGG